MLDVVVLGQGIAGLASTAAARAAGHRVTVVEADDVVGGTAERRGVPHGGQLHNLLSRGSRSLDLLFPKVSSSFGTYGGVRGDVSIDTYVHELGTAMPRRSLGLDVWSVTRAGLETALRRHAASEPDALVRGRAVGVTVRDGACAGVQVETDSLGPLRLDADLVVDATGTASRASSWTTEITGRVVPRSQRAVRRWYATAHVRPVAPPEAPFLMIFPWGEETRGGLASPRPDGTWTVSLNGSAVDSVPRTLDDFRAYARSLPDPTIASLLDGGEVSRPRSYAKPRATWHHFDQGGLAGLVAVGDASASLDPLVGQGMSGAAWEAVALHDSLVDNDEPAAITTDFARRSARLRRAMWLLAEEPGRGLVPPVAAWTEAAKRLADDPAAHRAYVDVWHLLAPVESITSLAAGHVPATSERSMQ